MTEDQFQVLRQELAGIRGDIDGRLGSLRAEINSLRAYMDRRFDGMEARLKTVEDGVMLLDAHLQDKPHKGYVYQALSTVNAGFVAIVGLLILILRTLPVA